MIVSRSQTHIEMASVNRRGAEHQRGTSGYRFFLAAFTTAWIFCIFLRSWANFVAGWRTMPRPL
jgi:hypothetical protein